MINITNDEVQIRFGFVPGQEIREGLKEAGFRWDMAGKKWIAARSDAREELAKQLEDMSYEELAESYVSAETVAEFDSLLSRAIEAADPDSEAHGDLRRKVFVAPEDCIEIIASSNLDSVKKAVLKDELCFFMAEMGFSVLHSDSHTAYLAEKTTYSLSNDYESELLSRTDFPAWIKCALKVDTKKLDRLSEIPEGVEYRTDRSVKIVRNPDKFAQEAVRMFRDGMSIREMTMLLKHTWIGVYTVLVRAVISGELNLNEFVTASRMQEILDYHNAHPETKKIADFTREFDEIPYDLMALVLKYLKIR